MWEARPKACGQTTNRCVEEEKVFLESVPLVHD